MPKKSWTDAERQAFGAKMKAARAAKSNDQPVEPQPAPDQIAAEESPTALAQQVLELKAQMELLLKMQGAAPHQGPQISGGRVVGTVEKYLVDPNNYPDPCERLSDEPKLQRFAFKTNYELVYEVQTTSYETKDGINMKEPRFNLELHRVVFDEDGQPTAKRVVLRKLTFHEDPQAAIIVARENELDPDNYPGGEKVFLDDMRYLRIRAWLLEAFYPPRNDQPRKNMREEVIGGKMFQTFEISSRDSSTIPFDQLDKKW